MTCSETFLSRAKLDTVTSRSHKSFVEISVFKTFYSRSGVWQDGMDTKLQMIEVLLGCNYPLLKQSGLSALINRFLCFLERADTRFT